MSNIPFAMTAGKPVGLYVFRGNSTYYDIIFARRFYMPDEIEIIAFNVGFGDCIHVTMPDNIQFLVDSGRGREKYEHVKSQLILRGKRVDFAILTHDHSDHAANFINFLTDNELPEALKIKRFYYWIDDTNKNPTTKHVLDKIKEMLLDAYISVTNIKHMDKLGYILLGEKVKILHPGKDSKYNPTQPNRNSIVLALGLEEYYLLLMGDATTNEESRIINKTKIDLHKTCYLKIGHHGSSGSSSEKFIKTSVQQEIRAVCSCNDNWNAPPPDNSTLNFIRSRVEEKGGLLLETGNPRKGCQDISIRVRIVNGVPVFY